MAETCGCNRKKANLKLTCNHYVMLRDYHLFITKMFYVDMVKHVSIK